MNIGRVSKEIEAYPYMIKCKKKSHGVEDYTIRRRTLNVAIACADNLKNVSFEKLTEKMFFACTKEMKEIVYFFESLLYECILEKDNFYDTLHERFIEFKNKITREKKLYLLVEFNNFAIQQSIKKDWQDKTSALVFGSYLSLIQQSITYFYNDIKENPLYYNEKTDSFVTIPDKYPMIDWCMEELTIKALENSCDGKKHNLSEVQNKCVKNFRKYGMSPKNLDDVDCIFASSNNYGNMLIGVLYYMNEFTTDITPCYNRTGAVNFEYPRVWYDTEYYKERLKRRNYALPHETIKVSLKYAKGIKEIYFKEVVKDEKIVLLYRLVAEEMYGLTDLVGYYMPSDGFFYSYYAMIKSGGDLMKQIADSLENCVLENYFLLTVRRTDEEKKHKPYSLPLIAEEYENVDKIPRWNNQPIVSFSVVPSDKKEISGDKEQRNIGRIKYKQGIYEYNDVNIPCFMRRLPNGYKASEDAKMNAEKYGYELEDGYTFVVPFERKQRRMKNIKMIGEK